MAVHTYLLDFGVGEEAVGTPKSRHDTVNAVEAALKTHFSGLTREAVITLPEALLLILVGPKEMIISVRTYKEGVVTVNIEHYKHENEKLILPYEKRQELGRLLENSLKCRIAQFLPPVKRPGGQVRYFTSADERVLEYDIDKILYEEHSAYQKIQIAHSKSLGNLLILDDLQNMSESDLIYTETLMQRGIQSYENKEIVILGGGDGCLLWELLKEKPKFVTMLELDEKVMEACRVHLRSSCGTCLDQYKGDNYEIIVGDCFVTIEQFIKEGKKVDFVFGDLTDFPVDSSGSGSESWSFIKEILNKSMQILRPGGKYLTHGNGSSVPKSLQAFESVLNSLKVPVDFTKTHAFVPSFMEDWVFYQVTPRLT